MYLIFSFKKKIKRLFQTDCLGEVVSVLNCSDTVNWAADEHLTVAEAVKLLTRGAETKLDAWNWVLEWWEFQRQGELPAGCTFPLPVVVQGQGFGARSGVCSHSVPPFPAPCAVWQLQEPKFPALKGSQNSCSTLRLLTFNFHPSSAVFINLQWFGTRLNGCSW